MLFALFGAVVIFHIKTVIHNMHAKFGLSVVMELTPGTAVFSDSGYAAGRR